MLHDAHPARTALARAAVALLLALALVVIPVALPPGASAQPQNRMSPAPRERVVIPFHGDPRVRSERPEGPVPRNLRIITDDEFPPLHFADPDGQPVGFSVDLMRAICERMAVACTIQVRRFDTLLQTLAEGQADIVAAAIPVTASLKSRFHVSRIYHRLPARFVGAAGFDRVRVEAGFAGVRVGVARDTAHAAYLAEHFPKAMATGAADLEAALQLLLRGEVELVFGDGQAAALWLGGRGGAGFRFVGGPFLGIRHFGEGIGFVLRPDEPNLKRAVDYALQGVWDDGTYARLFLRYFPVSAF
jgi:polar amino acid transport system substrate-binding protein